MITEISRSVVDEDRELLPRIPSEFKLTVSSAGKAVMPETGETGLAARPTHLSRSVDPSRPGGVVAVARTHLRSTPFHALHRLARGYVVRRGRPRMSFMEVVAHQGMAPAFARDFAGTRAPWDEHPEDVTGRLLPLPRWPPPLPRSKLSQAPTTKP